MDRSTSSSSYSSLDSSFTRIIDYTPAPKRRPCYSQERPAATTKIDIPKKRIASGIESDTSKSTASSSLLTDGVTELDQDEEFYIKLVDLIKEHPSLFDPLDIYFRTNKKLKEQYWEQIREKLRFDGTGNALNKYWNTIRMSYRTWRKENMVSALEQPHCLFPILFASMAWLDRFILSVPERTPVFSALYNVQRLLEEKETKAEKRRALLAPSSQEQSSEQSMDIFDISSSEELDLEMAETTPIVPAAPPKTRRRSIFDSTPRAAASRLLAPRPLVDLTPTVPPSAEKKLPRRAIIDTTPTTTLSSDNLDTSLTSTKSRRRVSWDSTPAEGTRRSARLSRSVIQND